MNYLRSRLLAVGAILAVPVVQLVACAQTERTYGPSGEGGQGDDGQGATGGSKPGVGGTSSGSGGTAEGGEGGDSGGGTAGDSSGGTGGSSSSGRGGTSTGGGQGGSSGDAGAAGEAGDNGSGGEAGGGNTVCVPTGTVESCADGIDNDCDGETDCLTLLSQFPDVNGAAAAQDVLYTFDPISTLGTFQCRSAHGDRMPSDAPWHACASVAGSRVFPFSPSFSADAANNGLWTTDVRLVFPGGGHSNVFSRSVYVHNSLDGAKRCDKTASDDEYAKSVAGKYLADTGAFDPSTVRSPFVMLKFTPPVSSVFSVLATDGTVPIMSLRRRFAFSADRHYLVITRAYSSRVGDMGCIAVEKRVHNNPGTWSLGNHSFQHCTALVLNTNGAGYCLGFDTSKGAITTEEWVRKDLGAQVPAPTYSPNADNFAWRKLVSHLSADVLSNFSPKCVTEGCEKNDPNRPFLYLPDSEYYPYWKL